MSEVEIIERPAGPLKPGPKFSARTVAFIETARTGKAVRLPLNGTPLQSFRNRFAAAARRVGLKAHTRRDGDYVIAWAEEAK
jgi:hypothetical protein